VPKPVEFIFTGVAPHGGYASARW